MVITDCGCCGGESGQVRQLGQVTWAQIPGGWWPVTVDTADVAWGSAFMLRSSATGAGRGDFRLLSLAWITERIVLYLGCSDHVSLQGGGIQNVGRKPTRRCHNHRPINDQSWERADCTISRQMVTQSSLCSHTALRGRFIQMAAWPVWSEPWGQGGSSLMKWNLGHENHSQLFTESVGHQPSRLGLCLTITHEPLSPGHTFLHQLSFNRSEQFTIIPGLGETLACALQFRKVWTLAHDNRQWEAKPSILSHSFQINNCTASQSPKIHKNPEDEIWFNGSYLRERSHFSKPSFENISRKSLIPRQLWQMCYPLYYRDPGHVVRAPCDQWPGRRSRVIASSHASAPARREVKCFKWPSTAWSPPGCQFLFLTW